MLAANHGQNRSRGEPFRSSSLMTLIPLVSRPSGRCCTAVVTRCSLPGRPRLALVIWPNSVLLAKPLARQHTANRANHASGECLPVYFPPSAPFVQQRDRARGALYGLAIGDALGMPTQLMSRRQVTERWGPLLTGFEPAPPGHPIAAGMPAGAVTDDTEQAVLLGRLLLS